MRIALAAAAICLASCGYTVSGHTDLMPKSIQTICIPAFGNATTRYKITDRLADAIAKEFISRSRYRIVTGRATAVDLRVYMKVTLTERATGKVLFTRPGMEVRERYEVSVDPRTYIDESDSALDRASRQVASAIVTAIMSNF